jgi:hypothetical protein
MVEVSVQRRQAGVRDHLGPNLLIMLGVNWIRPSSYRALALLVKRIAPGSGDENKMQSG